MKKLLLALALLVVTASADTLHACKSATITDEVTKKVTTVKYFSAVTRTATQAIIVSEGATGIFTFDRTWKDMKVYLGSEENTLFIKENFTNIFVSSPKTSVKLFDCTTYNIH